MIIVGETELIMNVRQAERESRKRARLHSIDKEYSKKIPDVAKKAMNRKPYQSISTLDYLKSLEEEKVDDNDK